MDALAAVKDQRTTVVFEYIGLYRVDLSTEFDVRLSCNSCSAIVFFLQGCVLIDDI